MNVRGLFVLRYPYSLKFHHRVPGLFFLALAATRLLCPNAIAQTNEWAWMGGSFTAGSFGVYGTMGTAAPGNAPGDRDQALSWTDSKGNLWLFGGDGVDSAGNYGDLNDLWEFNPSSNEWTWMGGSSTLPSGLVGPGVYGTLGTPAAGNIPPGRAGAVSWTDPKGNLWLFGGAGSGTFNDLWEYNPSTDEWTWISGSNTPNQPAVYGTLGTPAPGNVPGAAANGVGWTDNQGNFWLLAGNALWEFYPSTTEWAWMGGSGDATCNAVYGTLGVAASTNLPGNRSGAVGWTDKSGNFWLFGGSGCNSAFNGGDLNDLWRYSPSTEEWTWMSGADTTDQPGVYGVLQAPAAGNVPGSRVGAVSWTDSDGNFWLFGGVGRDSTNTSQSLLNDLWEFNPSTNEWSWMGGSPTADGVCGILANWCGQSGVYGTLHTPALGDTPGGRYYSVSWTDSKGNFWLFGGSGYDGLGTPGELNDLWEFQPNTGAQSVAATPIISPGTGMYTSWQSVTITDTTPGATISYLINGLTPASEYTGPITISSSESIEAIASAAGYANSNIATASYVANLLQAATPTFSVAPGTYATAQTVTISDTTPDATIYYAIGVMPTVPSTVYSGPITISSPETIQAIAVAENYLNSNVATAAYNIGANPSAEWTWMGGSSTTPICPNQGDCGQPGWYGSLRTPAATNIPEGRWGGVTWTDNKGNLWLFGGVGVQGSLNDLWEYNPAIGQWAWMAGNSTPAYSPVTGSGQPGVYGTLGTPSPENQPGSRFYAVGWNDKSGNLWLFGGWGFDASGDVGDLNDLWKFEPSTNQWTWMGGSSTLPCNDAATDECLGQPGVYGERGTLAAGSIPGGRSESRGWTDRNGNFWIYGGLGWDAREINCYLNDLWEFDPSANEWAWWGGYQSCPNVNLSGWPGVYGTLGVPSAANNPWSLYFASGWADSSGNLWLFGGMGEDTTATGYYMNDMWEFYPSAGEWAWMNANSDDLNYGSMGVWSSANIPGVRSAAANWTDSNGNFWLLGGFGEWSPSLPFTGLLNDLWQFKPSINEWAWMGGSASANQQGVYGVLGTPASANAPGARYHAATWTDSSGNLWLFGGYGDDAQGVGGYLNDLWQYSLTAAPAVGPPSPAAMPSFSLPAGTYTAAQALTLSDQTPGAVIYYTSDGTTPNGSSNVYNGQIPVSSSETIEAIAVANSYSVSPMATAAYTITLPLAATPAFSVPEGTYTAAQTVTISDATAGAAIYYTTDGSTPTTSSTVYISAITVSSTETLKAIATASGYSSSAVASATYNINLPASFTVAGTAVTVTPGTTTGNNSTITVTPTSGFTGTVSLSCTFSTNAPSDPATCSIPASVTITGTTAQAVMLTVNTTAAITGGCSAANVMHKEVPWYAAGDTILAGVLLFGIPAWRRRLLARLGMVALLVALTSGVLACGGSSGAGGCNTVGNPGTTAGNYTVIVTGISGAITETGTVSLTVQ